MTSGTTQPRQRVVVWRQLALGLGLFALYLAVDALGGAGRRAAADRHGRDIYALERHLHLDVETRLNDWLAPHQTLQTLANYEYAYTYIISALVVAVWVYVRRPEIFTRVRDSFIVLNVLAILCFALYPTTPPRLLPHLGFVDTVTQGRTVGSWGSGLVDHANQLAAMPSLHVGWALWVSAVLALLTARRWVQVASAVHVLLTFFVIVATANHYVLDAVAAAVLVAVAMRISDAHHDHLGHDDGRGLVVPSCDAFFLHVENQQAAQHVGGLVVFAPVGGDRPSVETIRALVEGELERLPRFTQMLAPRRRWRRARWVAAPPLDWSWHVQETRSTDGEHGLHRVVADLAEQPMPRDRPLWRIVLVRDVAPGRSGLVILMHHSVADGIGTVIQALNLLRPRVDLLAGAAPPPGRAVIAAGTVVGLAQLATDGGPSGRLPDGSPHRDFATVGLDLATVRRVATGLGVRVTDLVLSLTADAVHAESPGLAAQVGGELRMAVPLMVREPGAVAEGNATAAVMVDVPVDGRPLPELLAEVGRRTAPLRSPTRALASRFVMATGLRALPEPAVAWFARTVYGRRFFHAVVSNMPGPTEQFTMGEVPMDHVYPILPLAPGAPIALGALSWSGVLGVGLATDPSLIGAAAVCARMDTVLAGLEADLDADLDTVTPGQTPGQGAVSALGPEEGEGELRTDAR